MAELQIEREKRVDGARLQPEKVSRGRVANRHAVISAKEEMRPPHYLSVLGGQNQAMASRQSQSLASVTGQNLQPERTFISFFFLVQGEAWSSDHYSFHGRGNNKSMKFHAGKFIQKDRGCHHIELAQRTFRNGR